MENRVNIFKDLVNTVGFPIIAASALFWQVHLFRTELLQEFKEMNKNLNAVVTKVEIHDIRINKLENSRK
ncbi:hypothetical protein [Cetobacterium sp.]|uniref:hypothetical protein n=1 Tax=Cetobacterium sp. TaxID=2071632 RepID=UPI002FC9E9F3